MIEATNSVTANASVLAQAAKQTNANANVQAAAAAASTESTATAPKAPYISPYIFVDVNYDKAVLQIRNSDTGDVIRQFPSESRLQELRRQASAEQQSAQLAEATTGQQETASPSKTETVSDVYVPEQEQSAPSRSDAQLASAALANGALSSTPTTSGVSVLA